MTFHSEMKPGVRRSVVGTVRQSVERLRKEPSGLSVEDPFVEFFP